MNKPVRRELIEGKPVNIAIHRSAEGVVIRIVIYGHGIKVDISDPQPEVIRIVFSENINEIIQPKLR